MPKSERESVVHLAIAAVCLVIGFASSAPAALAVMLPAVLIMGVSGALGYIKHSETVDHAGDD